DVRQRAAGILCIFQGFLTQNPAAFVEIDDIFDVSDTPQASCSGKKHSGQSNGPVLFAPSRAAHRHYSLFFIIYYLLFIFILYYLLFIFILYYLILGRNCVQ
ncbi:MAG: hypothetical protein WAX56_03105, partial [Gemmiger qucibialis]